MATPAFPVGLLLTQSDERLVGYARAGHERAFEALVRRYRRQLHCYCRRLLLSHERAEDALQQALLQAWVALRDGAEVSAVRPWLYRIVHNAALDALRTSGYDYCTLSESLSGADAPQSDLDRRIAIREALAGLAALPDMQREALLRTAVEGTSHQKVASQLGLSESAVRGLVYRARCSLRAAVGAIVPPPLLSWALEAGMRSSPAAEGLAGAAGGGSAGIASLLVKGGAVAITAGALAGNVVAGHPPIKTTRKLTVAAESAPRDDGPRRSTAITRSLSAGDGYPARRAPALLRGPAPGASDGRWPTSNRREAERQRQSAAHRPTHPGPDGAPASALATASAAPAAAAVPNRDSDRPDLSQRSAERSDGGESRSQPGSGSGMEGGAATGAESGSSSGAEDGVAVAGARPQTVTGETKDGDGGSTTDHGSGEASPPSGGESNASGG